MPTPCVVAAAVLLALCCMSADGFFFKFENLCSPNPCPLNGNCQTYGYSEGYTCSCPPKLTPCNDEVMNLFKTFDYNRNGLNEWTVSILNPIDAVRFKSIYDKTVTEVATLNLPGRHNGEWDAVRHALTNYRWTKAVNAAQAKKFADAHERSNRNPFRELAMDLHNNNMGRQLAQDPANSKRKDVDVILEALNSGKLQKQPKSTHPSDVKSPGH